MRCAVMHTLQSEKTPVVKNFVLNFSICCALAGVPFHETLLEPCKVPVSTPCVCNYVIGIIGVFCDDGIIDDSAFLVEQNGEGRRVGCECTQRRRSEPFQESGGSCATEAIGS
jgi:hypothetical protein